MSEGGDYPPSYAAAVLATSGATPEPVATQPRRHNRHHHPNWWVRMNSRLGWLFMSDPTPPAPSDPPSASPDPSSQAFQRQSETQIAYMERLERVAVGDMKKIADLTEEVWILGSALEGARQRMLKEKGEERGVKRRLKKEKKKWKEVERKQKREKGGTEEGRRWQGPGRRNGVRETVHLPPLPLGTLPPPSRAFQSQSGLQIVYIQELEREAVRHKKEIACLERKVQGLKEHFRSLWKILDESELEEERKRRKKEKRKDKKKKRKGGGGPMKRGLVIRQWRRKATTRIRVWF